MHSSKHNISFSHKSSPHESEHDRNEPFLNRRSLLRSAVALVALTAGGTWPPAAVLAAKLSSKKLVKYQSTPKLNRKCADCTFYIPTEGACKVVEGAIEPTGWCLRWSKKK